MAIDTFRAPVAPAPASEEVAASAPLAARARRWRPGWLVLGTLALLMLASLWLRTRSIHDHFWIDEGLSVGIAGHPLSSIPGLLRQDGSPPLYYLILHVWMSAFGRGEVATHELSLVFALLTIPTAYWAGSSLFDRRTGLICAVIAAGASYLTVYGQETRMYALMALLSLLAAASFIEAFVRRRRRYLALFAVSLAAALYTHNWGVFLVLASVVAFGLCVRERRSERRELWRDGALAFGGAAILYAPWVPTVIYQAHHTGAPWDLPPVIWSISQGAYTLVGGRGAAIALLLGGGVGLAALRHPQGQKGWITLAAKCLLILGAGTVLIAWLYSKSTPAWAPRYLAVVVGPLLLLFGLGLARAGTLGIVALALAASFWVLDPPPASRDFKSNVAAVVQHERRQLPADTLVLATQPEQIPTLAYYLPHVSAYGTPLGRVPDPHIVDWRDALTRFRHSSMRRTLMPMLDAVPPGQRVALVVPSRFTTTPLWMKLIERSSQQWMRVLTHDIRFVRVSGSNADWVHAGVPVEMTVFMRL